MNETYTYDKVSEESAGLVLAELHRISDSLLQAVDTLDGKAASLLGWASLLVGFVSIFGLPWFGQPAPTGYHKLLLAGLVLYVLLAVTVLFVVRPRELSLSISTNWKVEYSTMDKGEKRTLLDLIATYNTIIEHNRKIVLSKSHGLFVGQSLMALLVILIVALATSPLWT